MPLARQVLARRDPTLAARVIRAGVLWYASGADASWDRPAHVRAGSGLTRLGGRLAVIQDDANFVAVVQRGEWTAESIVLPAGLGGLRQFDDGRRNKAAKLDLEACTTIVESGRES